MVNPSNITKPLSANDNAPMTRFNFRQYRLGDVYHNNTEEIDFVTNGKSLYVCVVDGYVSTYNNIDNESGFLKLVSQGQRGDQGVPGDDGKPGTTPNLTFHFIDRQLIIKENGVIKIASPDLTGAAWRPTLNGDTLNWELSKDKTVPQPIDLHDLTAPERPILLRTNSDNTKRSDEQSGPANFIQWKYEGDAEWTNLMSISELMNLALAGVSFWPDNDGYWHFGHKEVISATYDSTAEGRQIISNVELGDVLYDAGKVPIANYSLDIEEIKDRLDELENKPDADLSNYYTKGESNNRFQPKGSYITDHQPLKTINGQSLVGEGNITIEGGGATPDLSSYATKTWVNDQKFVKTVNGIAPVNGNVEISVAGNPIMSLFIDNNKLYKKSVNDSRWVEVGPVGGSSSGGGITEAQVKSIIGQALEGIIDSEISEYVRNSGHNYFIRVNDLNDALSNYYTKSQVYTKGEVDNLITGGEVNVYRTFMIFKRSASQTTETLPSTTITWNVSTGVLDIPSGSNGWSEHPENATSAKPYLWMASASFQSLNGERVGNWDGPFCLTGETGSDGTDGNGIEFIYTLVRNLNDKLSVITPVAPSGQGADDYPEGWEDHPQGIGYYLPSDITTVLENLPEQQTLFGVELASIRKYNGNTKQWGTYCEPFVWSMWGEDGVDGDGVEYIFHVDASDTLSSQYLPPIDLTDMYNTTGGEIDYSRPKPGYEHYQEQDWVPDGQDGRPDMNWSDNPSDVDEQQPYEWVSIRKYNGVTQKWGPFSEPKIWGLWGQKTIIQQEVVSGTTVYKPYNCYAFTRTNLDISSYRVTGGQAYENPLNGIVTKDGNNQTVQMTWSDGIPNGTQQLWSISALIGDETQSSDAAWTSPAKVGDRPGFQVEFADSNDNTDAVYNKLRTLPSLNGYLANNPEGVDEILWRQAAAANNCGNWSDNSGENTVYMAESRIVAGQWTDWNVIKIKGESPYVLDAPQTIFAFDAEENGALIEPVYPISSQFTLTCGQTVIPNNLINWTFYRKDEFYVWDGNDDSTIELITYDQEVESPFGSESTYVYRWYDLQGRYYYTSSLNVQEIIDSQDIVMIEWGSTNVLYGYSLPNRVSGLSFINGLLTGNLSDFNHNVVNVLVSATYLGITTSKVVTFLKQKQGMVGPQGVSGVPYFYQGDWELGKVYYNNDQRIDIVKNEGHWYICKQTHTSNSDNKPTWNDRTGEMNPNDYWEAFAGEFKNIATGFIFAEGGYIEGLKVKTQDVTGVLCANQIIVGDCGGKDEPSENDEPLLDYIDRVSASGSNVVLNSDNDYTKISLYKDTNDGNKLKTSYAQQSAARLNLYNGLNLVPITTIDVLIGNEWVSLSNNNMPTFNSGTIWRSGESVCYGLESNVELTSTSFVIKIRACGELNGQSYCGYCSWVFDGIEGEVYELKTRGITQLLLDKNDNINCPYDGGNSQTGESHNTEYYLANKNGFSKLSTDNYIVFFNWDDENTYYCVGLGVLGEYELVFKDEESSSNVGNSLLIHKHALQGDVVSGWADGNHSQYTVYAFPVKLNGNGVRLTDWNSYSSDYQNKKWIDYETTPIIRENDAYTLNVSMDYLPANSANSYNFKDFTITANVSKNGVVQDNTTFIVSGVDVSNAGLEQDCTTLFTQSNGILTITDNDFANWDGIFASAPKYIIINATCNDVTLSKQLYVIADGEDAVPYMYQGEWQANTTYVKNNQQVDVVKHENVWYMCNVSESNRSSFTSSDWTAFVGNFENIATGLLFAEEAYVDNLKVRAGDITGKLTADQIEVVDKLETINSNGRGIVISNNEINALSSTGSNCLRITGDTISNSDTSISYFTKSVNDEQPLYALRENNGIAIQYIDLLTFNYSNTQDGTISPFTFNLAVDSRATSGMWRFVLRRYLGSSSFQDYVLSWGSITTNGQINSYTTHNSDIMITPGGAYPSGLYTLAIKLEVSVPRIHVNYGKNFINTNFATVSIGKSSSGTLAEIGSNGAIFNFGNSNFVSFTNTSTQSGYENEPEMIIQGGNGKFGIKINGSGIYINKGGGYVLQS